MHMKAFIFFQPCPHFGMLVGGAVVDDQVQLKMLGRFSIDLFQKLQPLLMLVLALDGTDQASLKIVQHSEQGDRALADKIVRLRADMTDPQRQSRLGTLPGLNLAFFIATEHQCLIRQGQVQADDVPKLLFEVRVAGQF